MFGIDDAVAAVSNLASTVVTRVWPDATELEKAKLTLAVQEVQNEYNLVIGQIDINKIEAASSDWKVSGARPAAMWVGVITLLYNGIGMSLLSWVALCFGLPVPPVIPDTGAVTALFALLGIGGLRTYDKVKGIDTKKVGK
jgi:hypothetical protein